MTRREWLPLLAGVCAAQELPVIRVDVNLVNLPFSVRDRQGRLVESLSRDEIEVLEDGVPQTITHFSQGLASSLTLGLIADASGSQKDFLKDHRRDLRDFLKDVAQPRDQAFLVCFGNQLRLVSPLSPQMDRLTVRLEQFQKAKHLEGYPKLGPAERRVLGTAFYDAIYYGTEEILARVDEGRRVMIVFSDGEDNASAHHMLDAIETAQRAGVQIFCIRYTEVQKGKWTARNKYGRAVMERLARDTGGLDLDATDADNLRPQFRQIAEILRASYDLGYRSSNPRDGSFHKIVLRSKKTGLVFRHKTGYFSRVD
ncbi:MAG TPA: VWA domain-containing protein [Bryobacteraceae bacterium]|nr:VWA domain-containing protein [Bryobacteraceae bacterium]